MNRALKQGDRVAARTKLQVGSQFTAGGVGSVVEAGTVGIVEKIDRDKAFVQFEGQAFVLAIVNTPEMVTASVTIKPGEGA